MEHNLNYIVSLLTPRPGKAADRKVWSVELFGVWLPFFTATNAQGVSSIPAEALGAPLRLQKEQDGTPKFSKSGRPILRVVRELSDQVRIVRENFVAGLLSYTDAVRKAMPAEFKAQLEANYKAGEPIAQRDITDLNDYLKAVAEAKAAEAAAKAEAEAPVAEGVVAEAEAVVADAPKGKRAKKPQEDKELVPA